VTEDELRGCLAEYLGLLQRHPSAEEMMSGARAHALEFFLRRWEAPSPTSDEFTGSCYHSWRLRRAPDRWRVAAQMVERFADLNDNAERLFATPDEGLNR
jgi:hypothetical protein